MTLQLVFRIPYKEVRQSKKNGAKKKITKYGDDNNQQEPMSRSATAQHSCHDVFVDRFIFRSNFPWECHDQSLEIN